MLLNFSVNAQIDNRSEQFNSYKKWFVSSAFGVQISGIKEEDFVSKNIAPALTISSGLWFNPSIGLQFSYKGPYFHTISDDDKRPYLSIFGEVLFNLNEIVNGEMENNNNWNLIIHSGPGYFHNKYFNKVKLNGNLGIINDFKLTESVHVFVDVSFIVGWDIYQGDEDILPSGVLGISYLFN